MDPRLPAARLASAQRPRLTSTPAIVSTEELLPQLTNGQQVILSDFGHSGDFWEYQPDASQHLLTSFGKKGDFSEESNTETISSRSMVGVCLSILSVVPSVAWSIP